MSELSTYISVDTEDLDETPVTLAELPSFVRVYFGDNSDGRHVPNDRETDQLGLTAYRKLDVSTGRETIYIEDAFTGEFIPITVAAKKFDDSLTDDSGDGDEHMDSSENGDDQAFSAIVDPFADESVDLNHVQYITFLRILFLFVQGILAGFSFITIYVEITGGSDVVLLENYAPSANEYRRFFYVLTSLAVIGSCDLLMSRPKGEVAKKQSKIAAKKGDGSADNLAFVSFLALLAYSLCFLCTLVIGVTDTLIYYRDGISTDGAIDGPWAAEALRDAYFSSSYDNWRALGYVRFASAFLGFVCSCFILWSEFISFYDKNRDISFLKAKCVDSQRKISELSGEKIGDLNIMELENLLQTQKLGMERTTEALKAFGE